MKKILFASDFHLGYEENDLREREKQIIRWLDYYSGFFDVLFLVGDIFDFWFEYNNVIPKGFTRFLGKIAELKDSGKEIHFFSGNHDVWMFDYFQKEFGIIVHHEPFLYEANGKKFFIAHGDGLGPGDKGYKRLKKIFRNKVCQWLFKWLHPDIGIKIATYSSRKSRSAQKEPEYFLGKDKEWLFLYAERKLKKHKDIDYFIFGHRHLPIDALLENKHSRYINLGDWINHRTYMIFENQDYKIKAFENNEFNHENIKY